MKATLVDLRRSPAKILEAVDKREHVTLSRRGKAIARIVPVAEAASAKAGSHEAFGMWRDHAVPEVAAYVRAMRKGRFSDL